MDNHVTRSPEDELRHARQMLAQAAQLAQLGYWYWDVVNDRIEITNEFRFIFDPSGKVKIKSFRDLMNYIHPENRINVQKIIQDALKTSSEFAAEFRITRPDGTERMLRTVGYGELETVGDVRRVRGIIQDITQRQRVAEKLTHLADQLKLLNQMGQGVVSNLDPQTIFTKVLTTVRKLVGAQDVLIFLEKNGHLIIEAQDEVSRVDLRGQHMKSEDGIAGYVWTAQEGVNLSGDECRARFYPHLAKSIGYTPSSLLAAPITWQQEKLGVFQAMHNKEDAFADEDLGVIENAATWTAIALGNAFQHQRLERRLAESQVTAELLEEILNASLSLQSVLQHVVDAAANIVFQADWAAIHLRNERDNRLYPEATSGVTVSTDDYILEHGQGIAGQVFESGQFINVPDASEDPRVVGFPRISGAHSLLVAPIKQRDNLVIGTITLQSSTAGQFEADDEHSLILLARQAGLAIENARLYETAEHRQQVAQIQRERMRQLAQQTVTAQEEERERIARELHDEAGQSLTALKISLEMMVNQLPEAMQEPRMALKEAAELAGQTLENIRLIAHNLRPPALDRLGLNLALVGLCQQFDAMTHIQVHYDGFDLPRLTSSHEITLYRFVQEALTNVAKHANASEIRVWMLSQTGQIEIHIQDNGQGMLIDSLDSESLGQEGMGFTSMVERLKMIDGFLDVQSTPGSGTYLRARVPLRLQER
jgi:signal transduction histidine kinase